MPNKPPLHALPRPQAHRVFMHTGDAIGEIVHRLPKVFANRIAPTQGAVGVGRLGVTSSLPSTVSPNRLTQPHRQTWARLADDKVWGICCGVFRQSRPYDTSLQDWFNLRD